MADFDLAVIGAGAAGLAVTAVAAQLGLAVLLVERDRMGGDCLNAGCVPSKALLAAAHAAAGARAAGRFGVRLPPPRIDWGAVSAHVAGAIAAIAPNDSEERFRGLGATVIKAAARFTAPGAIAVEGRRITARRFVIAAGSRPAVPAIPGLDHLPFLTNSSLFGIPGPAGHLLILGGGPVGLEMAAAHAALGWEVSLVEATAIAGREDPELVAGLRAALAEGGVRLFEGTAVAAAEPGPTLVLADGRRLTGSHLLIAAGRRPNLEDLGLEAGAIRASGLGIATDRGLRSLSNRLVYAVGDIADPAGIGPRYFTHVGSYHAGIVIRRALFRLPARIDYRALPRVLYTEPELAQVGLTEAEARAAGHDVRVAPLAPGGERPGDRRGRDARPRQARREQAGPAPRRRDPLAHGRRDDRALHPGDRAAAQALRARRDDPALSDPRRGGQAGRQRLLCPVPLRRADPGPGAAARPAAVRPGRDNRHWSGDIQSGISLCIAPCDVSCG